MQRTLRAAACLLASCPAGRAAPAPQQPALVIEIRGPEAPVAAGDEIGIVFAIRNAGARDYSYTARSYDRSGRIPEFALSARDERGVPVPDPRAHLVRGIGGGLGQTKTIAPGQSVMPKVHKTGWCAKLPAPPPGCMAGSAKCVCGQGACGWHWTC